MANHPYNLHREQQVAHRRVNTVLKGEPAGAKQHAAGSAFSKVTSKSAAQSHDDTVRGSRGAKRFARGGKVKGDTNITIVVPGGGKPPMDSPPIVPPIPMPPPGGPPMAGPPGMPPGGPPPGMPMRASGGRVNSEAWGRSTAKERYARGGAATGVGREEKAARMKRK